MIKRRLQNKGERAEMAGIKRPRRAGVFRAVHERGDVLPKHNQALKKRAMPTQAQKSSGSGDHLIDVMDASYMQEIYQEVKGEARRQAVEQQVSHMQQTAGRPSDTGGQQTGVQQRNSTVQPTPIANPYKRTHAANPVRSFAFDTVAAPGRAQSHASSAPSPLERAQAFFVGDAAADLHKNEGETEYDFSDKDNREVRQPFVIRMIAEMMFLFLIYTTGWFLIGYYLEGEFLSTNYQDWIYHAWRIDTLQEHQMITSWDHQWTSGINHWRSYQYIQHVLVLGVVQLTGLSITKAMILLTVVIYIGIRFLIYGVLRSFGVGALASFIAVLFSFTYVQQWIAISDFSIFIAFIIVPFYILLWKNIYERHALRKDLDGNALVVEHRKRRRAEYFLALLTGATWILHPIIANVFAGIFFYTIGFRSLKISLTYALSILAVYIIGALAFFLPYFSAGYHFANPVFTTTGFVTDTIAGEYFGLSFFFWGFTGFAIVVSMLMPSVAPAWARRLLGYSILYFILIYFAQNGYVPKIITQLQISRVIPVLALLIIFAFAGILDGFLKSFKMARPFIVILAIFAAISIIESVKIGTAFTSQPRTSLDDPVSLYFNGKEDPKGSIYVRDVSSASYFSEGDVRFINSYNEHLLPNPLSVRFGFFMRSEIAYTGVSRTHEKLIRDYSTVMGLEYIVLPQSSPLIRSLTQKDEGQERADFEFVETLSSFNGVYTIIRRTAEIHNAYLINQDDRVLTWDQTLENPTIEANSYQQWDRKVSILAEKMRNGEMIPLDTSFTRQDQIAIDLTDQDLSGKALFVAQSYDPYWSIVGRRDVVKPSEIRMIHVEPAALSDELVTRQDGRVRIVLENNWPWWHWPLQFFALGAIGLIFVAGLFSLRGQRVGSISRKRKQR